MKKIPLTQGQFALVDDEDYEWLNQWKWYAHKNGKALYALRNKTVGKKQQKTVYMHRVILNTPNGILVDHLDRNGLNNQKCNIRTCNSSQNQMNRSTGKDNSSGFKGVNWNVNCNKWIVRIRTGGKRMYLGCFFCLMKAAKAYDAAARKYHGEFARTNFNEKGDRNV